MFTTTVIVTVVLAGLLVMSAILKLSRREPFLQGYLRVGVPEKRLNQLAVILLAGSAGLVLGLFWAPLGIAAAIGVVAYFSLAIASHIRAHDVKNLPAPVTFAAIAVATLVLRLATA